MMTSIAIFATACLVVLIYLLPSVRAFLRGHHSTGAILVLNLGLGWTVLGWVAAFVWAGRGSPHERHPQAVTVRQAPLASNPPAARPIERQADIEPEEWKSSDATRDDYKEWLERYHRSGGTTGGET